eukprot:CAMPEP_0201606570 /NCGR_PEP_ID=MMETSP0492-20130828/5973_1 /ASSEMBLY_ACC=CAM_ASM_000837 /TAXON_ID=420259 /ORGANISM="Thalassiosira gravida, Strain GMp14c1" /LENGTH=195 /DNA_ID=CAMNT_0048070999 /DNA_START=164 /DNA_END=751 /DNA_ORIENTATION=+
MIRALHPRSNGVTANAAAILLRSVSPHRQPSSRRALSIAPVNSGSSVIRGTPKQPTATTRSFRGISRPSRPRQQSFRGSTAHSKSASTSASDVYVTVESGSSDDSTDERITEQSTTTSGNGEGEDSSSSSGSTCSQGIPDLEMEEDDDQEEMFVMADPVLGLGTIQEWGGPRRGGSLSEPTRFGDWERKGRCTDF